MTWLLQVLAHVTTYMTMTVPQYNRIKYSKHADNTVDDDHGVDDDDVINDAMDDKDEDEGNDTDTGKIQCPEKRN